MTPRMKTLLAGMALGLSVNTSPIDAKEWSGTIGEPLRDSSEQALQLVDHLLTCLSFAWVEKVHQTEHPATFPLVWRVAQWE